MGKGCFRKLKSHDSALKRRRFAKRKPMKCCIKADIYASDIKYMAFQSRSFRQNADKTRPTF